MQQSLGIMLRRAVESVVCVAQFSLVPHLINIQCLGHGLELADTKNLERMRKGRGALARHGAWALCCDRLLNLLFVLLSFCG